MNPSDGIQHLRKLPSAKVISPNGGIRFKAMTVCKTRKIDLVEQAG